MTKKREMAEWILDFFRRGNVDAGQIVMMRSLQNKLIELTPKERDLFVPVANELIGNGYFTYEEGQFQNFRLTEKGRAYIYNPDAELDCCNDDKLTPAQARYIENWHENFVNWVNGILRLIDSFYYYPQVTENDKATLNRFKDILNGVDVKSIEESLSTKNVTTEMLDKIEKLNKDLVDVAVEHLQTEALVKAFWRQLTYLKINIDRKSEEQRLNALKIHLP